MYTASLDRTAKIISAGVFLLLLGVMISCVRDIQSNRDDLTTWVAESTIIVFLILLMLICWIYAPQGYNLTANDLQIVRKAGNISIPLKDIASVQDGATVQLKGTVRTLGVGGLFGYYGRFYNSSIGHFKMHATQRKNMILLMMRNGKKVVITPDDPSLAQSIKSKLAS